jgi:hypothetical protein
MKNIILVNDIIFPGLVGALIAKINNWNILVVSGIYIIGYNLFPLYYLKQIINKKTY